MTHFEYQKASKIAFENQVKKLCARVNFHANRHVAGTVAPPIKADPLHFGTIFARALGLLER